MILLKICYYLKEVRIVTYLYFKQTQMKTTEIQAHS